MRISTRFSLLLITLFLLNCSSEKKRVLQINGEVVNTDTRSILLVKPGQDMTFDSIIEIPVENGKFYFESKLENPEAVTLFVGAAKENGGGRYMPLFLENDSINLTIYSEEEFDKNIVEGGKLNAEYKKYKNNFDLKYNSQIQPLQDSMRSLFENDQYHSDEMKMVLSELREAKSHDEKIVFYKKMEILREEGLDKSVPAKAFSDKQELIYKETQKYQQDYMDKNPTLVSYSFLLQDLIYKKEKVDVNLAKTSYKKLSEAHPNHPYNEMALNLITAINNIKTGKSFVDFWAPDLSGNKVRLSDKINGQVALLDLWATWCGPCIAKSRTMIPLYDEFKEKGFTIIGVAGEFENTDRLIKFFEKEKWPWLNLVELDRQNKIWQKYGVDGGGGGIFLIDKNGKILAKDPTAEEVRLELESRLN